ncbi:protein AATF-like [Pyrus ussuriensis x Pyrus communis]|uniref:Protein AATF-like n=1 Tax=Pyrus ussuriensis x Pyrus communis TaxID=2448454 RepID=A0A5N5I4I6_9ROSA|nr:protein AATF-like [Pyrus ussuriensis x Pyrus communis]
MERKARESNSEFEDDGDSTMKQEEDEFDEEHEEEEEEEESENEEEDGGEVGEEENGDGQNDSKDAEMEELETECMNLRRQEQDILKNLKGHKDEDLLKGQVVKNQKALWDKALEFRFLLQKAFSSSHRLPKEPVRSLFCDSHEGVNAAYSDLVDSSRELWTYLWNYKKYGSLLEKNPSIVQAIHSMYKLHLSNYYIYFMSQSSKNIDGDEDWSRLSELLSRIATFRNKSINKWQRKTQVTAGAAAFKSKLHAFNQNISEQGASYMRDPSRMVRQMQMRKSAVAVFVVDVQVPEGYNTAKGEETQSDTGAQADGDPELLDDSRVLPAISKRITFYSLKKLHAKKRKIVDRRASKSRKIINFMPPETNAVSPMLPDLNNLFGLKKQKPAFVVQKQCRAESAVWSLDLRLRNCLLLIYLIY